MEEEIIKTNKIGILFEIDVPRDSESSDLNTIILEVNELRNNIRDYKKEPKIINHILERIIGTANNMKYKEE